MNKIGFHFVTALPSDVNPNETQSFFYIKREVQRENSVGEQVVDKFAEVYLGIRNVDNTSTFHSITQPINFYPTKINGRNMLTEYEKHPAMGVNLTLEDICNFQPGNNLTTKELIFSNDVVLSKEFKTLYVSNILNQATEINTDNDTNLFFGLNIGNKLVQHNFNNNTILGNDIKFQNVNLTGNIIIANDIELPVTIANKTVINNLFVGGIYYDETTTEYILNNSIEGNIFVKNLGYGNISSNFHLTLPLRLSSNTELANIEDSSIQNYPRIAVVKTDGTIGIANKVDYLPTSSLQQILNKSNTSTKEIIINGIKFVGSTSAISISNNLPLDGTYVKTDSIVIGIDNFHDTVSNSQTLNLSTSNIIGSKNLDTIRNSYLDNIVGSENIKYVSKGLDKLLVTPEYYSTKNNIVGYNNIKINENVSTIQFNNIVGSDNLQNGYGNNIKIVGSVNLNKNIGNNNIIIGDGNLNSDEITYYENKIIIGNQLSIQPGEDLVIGKINKHYLSANFTTNTLSLNGKLKLNFNDLQNQGLNIEYNKILVATSEGLIGYQNKTDLFEAPKERFGLTTETLTNKVYGENNNPVYRKTLVYEYDATVLEEIIIPDLLLDVDEIVDVSGMCLLKPNGLAQKYVNINRAFTGYTAFNFNYELENISTTANYGIVITMYSDLQSGNGTYNYYNEPVKITMHFEYTKISI